MAKRSEFVEYIQELLGSDRPTTARAMFGGWGLYREGLMCGLVADDTLYLKADDANAADFDAQACEAFVFTTKDGREMAMSYRRLPEAALEDGELMAHWMDLALAAALRADQAKPPARRKHRPPNMLG